jgi:hypothetical protein
MLGDRRPDAAICLCTLTEHISVAFINISFIYNWLYSPSLDPGLFFGFVIFFVQTVGLLGRAISPSQGRYLHTGQHKHRINTQTSMPWVGFEPTIATFEQAKTARPLWSAHQHLVINLFVIRVCHSVCESSSKLSLYTPSGVFHVNICYTSFTQSPALHYNARMAFII